MNLPNKLAMLRMILVIPFIVAMEFALKSEGGLEIFLRIISTFIFVVAAITDYFDGKIAREHNMITNLGKLIDPLADKILVISALLLLTKYDSLNLWIVIIIIFRELLITGLRSILAVEGVVVPAEKTGKLKTVTQMVALTIILMFPMAENKNNLLMAIPLFLTILSGVEYLIKSKEILIK